MTRSLRLAALTAIPLLGSPGCTEPSEAEVLVDVDYYRPEGAVVANLVARDDGTFDWRMVDCKLDIQVSGEWSFDGDTIVVRPSGGQTQMRWVHVGGMLTEDIASLVLSTADAGKTLDLVGRDRSSDTFDEVWRRGARCLDCTDPSDPSQSSCDEPF